MAQLKEDEWPDAGEPTTTEREVGLAEVSPDGDRPGTAEPAPARVPADDARLKNVTPDEAVD